MFEWIQYGTSKALVFVAAIFFLTFSVRNYARERHNEVVNRHRSNALLTHRTLLASTTDPTVRTTFAMQAATCMYAVQGTGYGQTETASVAVTPQAMLEMATKPPD